MKWTKEETELLEKHYLQASKEELLSLLPNRTYISIKGKAVSLKLKRKYRCWGKNEIIKLKELYPKFLKEEILKALPKRNWEAIKKRACFLKIKRRDDIWSKDEIQLLKKHYPISGTKELLILLPNRTQQALHGKAKMLGVKKYIHIKWSKNDIELLKKIYSHSTKEELLKAFPKRSYSSIKDKACRIQISKSDNWTWGKPKYLSDGYIELNKQFLPLEDRIMFKEMFNGNRISEHRYIMSKHLRRALKRFEEVHHLNEIKTDNRIENLVMIDTKAENHPKEVIKKAQAKRIRELEKELERPQAPPREASRPLGLSPFTRPLDPGPQAPRPRRPTTRRPTPRRPRTTARKISETHQNATPKTP